MPTTGNSIRDAWSLGIEMKKIGKIVDVRWLSSSYRTVDVVYSSVPTLAAQLALAGKDKTSTVKIRVKAKGMVKKLHSWIFLAELALIRDILGIL